MQRKQLTKNQESDEIVMNDKNLKICLQNQEGAYQTPELNDSLHLQYYGFSRISNLEKFRNVNTIFFNNNVIKGIERLSTLTELRTLNLANNRICKIQNLNELVNLYTLDLSENQITGIQLDSLTGLDNLNTLKLNSNKLEKVSSLYGLLEVKSSLSCLNLSQNENLEYDENLYSKILVNFAQLSMLVLKGTTFSRSFPKYRKQTIATLKKILYLDDRPVTEEERLVDEGWKEGGKQREQQIKKLTAMQKLDKSQKIYHDILEKNKEIEDKRQKVFDKITEKEQQQLKKLINSKKSETIEESKKFSHDLQIQQLQQYLQMMKDEITRMDLQKELGNGQIILPKMIIDEQKEDAIYVYNVEQEQIPLITQKFYPNATKPIIAVSTAKKQSRWINEYETILHQSYEDNHGQMDLLIPTFNMRVYKFDRSYGRKIKRFGADEIKDRLKQLRSEEDRRQHAIEVLDQLD